MQLVKSRPIALPVQKDGNWFDDFATTGASEISAVNGNKAVIIKQPEGVQVSPTSAGDGFAFPSWFTAVNFEAELVLKRVAGLLVQFEFRRTNDTNRWYIEIHQTSDKITLWKSVGGVYTNTASKTNIVNTSYHRYGVRAVGGSIEVFLDGLRIFNVNSSDNITNKNFRVYVYDPTAGVAKANFQYLAIRRL